MNNPKRILVTGGAGFIGSHLCAQLLEQGHYVLCLDNLFTGHLSNIANLQTNPRFQFIKHDIANPIHLQVNQIYNLACPASPVHYQYDPVQTVKTNVQGMMHMLELARKTGATILQASTSEVYGDPNVHPQPESYWGHVNCTGPRACYDEGKRCAETLCFDYHRQFGLSIKVARIFNTYGPNMLPNDGRVVSNFIVQALKGENITIYGTGQQTRSFCYVSDLVAGLMALMNTPPDITGPINLGNPTEFTMLELAEKVIQQTKSKSTITFHPLPQDDPRQRKPDITLANQHLAWKPSIKLEDGLKPTIAYFRERITNTNTPPNAFVFVSNAPSPYQLDLFNALASKTPVAGYFQAQNLSSANTAWNLSQPAWLHTLPSANGLAKAYHIIKQHTRYKPSCLLLGGYRNPGHLWLMLWAKWHRIPLWLWMEAPEPHLNQTGWRTKLKRALRHMASSLVLPLATGICAIDSRAQKAYSQYHSRVVWQPYAIRAEDYPPRKPHKGPLRCLYLGQLIHRKGIPDIIQAFTNISPKQAHLTLAGTGPLKANVEAFCAKTGHTYKGFVQPADLPALLAAHDIFVFPSHYDGWAVVVAQAMAAGLPIISYPAVGASNDLIGTSGTAGTLCEPNATSLEQAVQAYIKNPQLIETQGATGRRILFASPANAERAANFFLSLTQSNP